MLSRWSDADAAGLDDLDLLVYASRLIGADDALVVWGGGNTSLKRRETDFRGRPVEVLRVKGSGSDLKAVRRADFPGVRLDDVRALLEREAMPDEEMVAYLRHTLLEPDAPRPSIETLLHAWIPAAAVAHSHADAILMLTNTAEGVEHVRRCFGERVAIVPYIRPGFRLSKVVAEAVAADRRLRGVVLMKHGLFTWGDDPRASYATHLELVTEAEEYVLEALARSGRAVAVRGRTALPGGLAPGWWLPPVTPAAAGAVFGGVRRPPLPQPERRRIAARLAPILRGALGAERRVVLRFDDGDDVLDFLASARAAALSQVGPATPDHLLNTRRLPLWLEVPDPTDAEALAAATRDGLARYVAAYRAYVARHNHEGHAPLEPFPRVVLVPGIGMWTAGRDARAARIAGDIYHHTISVMAGASALGRYESLTEEEAFGAEYWPLELYKLTLLPPEQELARRVALVTGAGRGIGRAIAERFAAAGAHVVVTDLDAASAAAVAGAIEAKQGAGRAVAVGLDVTDEAQVCEAFRAAALAYGGVDIVVSNAGIAESAPVEQTDVALWRRSLEVNATGHFLVAREGLRLMRRQGLGGTFIFVVSKNVPAPGKDFAAYSAAKAAEAQLARIVAIEGAEIGVRANMLHPDAVFEGSGLFSPELRAARAAAHGVAPEALEEFYRQRNLLRVRVLPEDVAEAALFLASDRSAKTTGAALAVDGGVREAFPR
jgi:rhamnose utilization protein RhaD (predicted bifunctional aldolase and dehydrogenase)/NAD(P)-dependent dehydrogenase (short-subunit alcohol dehydrogenase family)